MAAVVRADKFSNDSATIHDIDFPSGTTTAGNLVAMLLDTAGTISSVTPRGASGTVSLADDAPDYAGFGNSGYVYTLPEADAAITGLRVTLTGDSPIAGQLLEIEDSDGIDGVIGVRTGTFNAAGTRVSITTLEDNSIGAGFVFTSGGGGTFTPDSNNTDVESNTTSASFYTGSLSTAGAKTIGGVMSSATFCYGFGVAFRHADSGGSASTITAAAGVATASSMAGSSTASTAITGASGAATASTMAGSGQAIASFTAAAGAATASSRTGSSTATGSTTQASGAATASSMAGSSTASAAFTAATGAATAATMSSDAGAASFTQADGVATTSSMAGSSTAVASFVSASGTATTATFAGPQEAATTGAPGPAHRFIAYINGKRVVGSYWEIQRLVEEIAQEQAEKDVAKPKPAKKPRIVVQPGKPVEKSISENIPSISDTQGREIQAEIRNIYHIAYIRAKLRAEQDEEDTLMVLL